MILNDAQNMMREAVCRLVRKEITPNAAKWAATGAFPPALFETLASFGIMGMMAPRRLGGSELDYVSYALVLMEIAAGDGALSTVVSVHNAPVLAALSAQGSDLQLQRFLPDLIAGKGVGAFALTEPEAGSDAAALKCKAEKVAGGYRLNGAKQFITSAQIASVFIVFAVTDQAAGKKGISAFLLPADSPGLHVASPERKLGQSASDTCAIVLENVFLADDLLLGAEGDGYRIALQNLEAGRIGIAAQSVGMARAAIERATDYALERTSFGRRIFKHQAVSFRLADLATQLEAARQLVFHAAQLKQAGLPCLRDASMAKLFASEAAERICSGALQTLGGYGYLEDFDIARIYRDVRVCQIYEGTSDIQRMVISRELERA